MKLLNFLFFLFFVSINTFAKEGQIIIESLIAKEVDFRNIESLNIDLKKISMEKEDSAIIPFVGYSNTQKKIVIYLDNSINFFNVPSKITSLDSYVGCFSESKNKLFFLINSHKDRLLLYETGKLIEKEKIHEYSIENKNIKWVGNNCKDGYILLDNGGLNSFDIFSKSVIFKVLIEPKKEKYINHNFFVDFDGSTINFLTKKDKNHYFLKSSYFLNGKKYKNYGDFNTIKSSKLLPASYGYISVNGENIFSKDKKYLLFDNGLNKFSSFSSDSLWPYRVDACDGRFLLNLEPLKVNEGKGIVAIFIDKNSGKKVFSRYLYDQKFDGVIFSKIRLGKIREKYVVAALGSSLLKNNKGFYSKYMMYFFGFDVAPYCS